MIISKEILFKKKKDKFYKNILSDKTRKNNLVDIISYEPTNKEECPLGNFYFIAEISDAPENAEQFINILGLTLKKEYYNKTNLDNLPFNALENSVKKTNLIINELRHKTSKKNHPDWLNNLNCICAVINQDSLCFTQLGEFTALLFRQGVLTNINEKFNGQKNNAQKQIFKNIISGILRQNDKIIFLPSIAADYLTIQKIKQICAIGTINENYRIINKILKEHKTFSDFLAAVMLEASPDKICYENALFSDAKKYITPPISLNEVIPKNL